MPIIPAEKDNWIDLTERMFLLWLDPTNPQRDRRMFRDLKGHAEVAMMELFPDHVKPTAERARLALNTPPDGIQIRGNLDDAAPSGYLAGLCLYGTLRLAVHAPKHASLANSIHIAAAFLKSGGFASGRSTLMEAWKTHRTVSHFWAAYIHEPAAFATLHRAISLPISRKQVEDATDKIPVTAATVRKLLKKPSKLAEGLKVATDKHLPHIFAIAERMRELAERHYAPNQKARGHHLLPNGTAWKIPASFSLPAVKINFPKLTRDEKKLLKIGLE